MSSAGECLHNKASGCYIPRPPLGSPAEVPGRVANRVAESARLPGSRMSKPGGWTSALVNEPYEV